NNDPLNLLPLCVNHHLADIHNPTKKTDPLKLGLFRKYKDPQILSPQFEPVFQRLRFLLVSFEKEDQHVLCGLCVELAKFIEGFTMGDYYCSRLLKLLKWPQPRPHTKEEEETALSENAVKYIKQLQNNKNRVFELCIEMLRYQSWPIFRGEPFVSE
ncbi:MAG: hypothetical protein SVY10_16585, partial [Thermodesulfobacteriota bacterium]|nr:hypothetical protein [Thermodesulfobacteriota bacterium]